MIKTVAVTGGAGYVGAVLVPALLEKGFNVKVIDLYLYGDVLRSVQDNPALTQVKGDIRDQALLKDVLKGCDAVIHLACISNDPSFELDPDLGRSINYDAFKPLVTISRDSGVSRFIYASTSSVYGISEAENVTEEHPLNPITDYSKYKALCEPLLLEEQTPDFSPIVIRPATVCGYSPRQRLDLSVNILTNHAVNRRKITIFGGTQKRPNLHINDMVELYIKLLELPNEKIAGRTYNAGYQNRTMNDIAGIVKETVEREAPSLKPLELITTPTDDLRSYHISSEKIQKELGFIPRHSIEDAVRDLVHAFQKDLLPNAMNDPRYYNIKTMQAVSLK
jgi:nucleoside-diphosphate-sugar epimerase